jgi:O-acetyl-ADP-ribose deacetylase (regulator of RNase III)
MKEVDGDLLELAMAGEFDAIAHGANCFHTMGSGIAKQISSQFPLAYEIDRKTVYGSYNKLGTYSKATVVLPATKFIIYNLYTQFNPGPDLSYLALQLCLRKLAVDTQGMRIGLPLIGCGIAGGDWNVVKVIIEEELSDSDITIVNFKPVVNLF